VLLSGGADPNFRCKPDSSSPFQVAISTNNVELIKALVTHGADLGQKNKFGEDALDIAFFEQQSKAVQTLLEIQGGDDHPKESIAFEIAMAHTYDVVRAIISTAQIMYPQMANNQGVTLNDFGWMEWVLNKAGSLIRPRAAYRMMHFALKEQNVRSRFPIKLKCYDSCSDYRD
jgi:ankyrin repeat protein